MREDRIISALIGLVGACGNHSKTDDTDSIVIRALAFPLLCPEYDDEALQGIVDDIYSEKFSLSPGCAACTAPCGNTSDYDMRRIYEADDKICQVKLRILGRLRKLAAHVWHDRENGGISCIDSEFFYRALSCVSYDMDETGLLDLLDEVEKIENNMESGGTKNDQENYKD